MMLWHGYFGIENLNLSDTQRATLVSDLKGLGVVPDRRQPCWLNHWKTRSDNQAVIYEALWNADNITIQAVKNRLGVIFDISPSLISHATQTQSFAGYATQIITFDYGGINYIRMAVFGGVSTAREISRQECVGYIIANVDEWEQEGE